LVVFVQCAEVLPNFRQTRASDERKSSDLCQLVVRFPNSKGPFLHLGTPRRATPFSLSFGPEPREHYSFLVLDSHPDSRYREKEGTVSGERLRFQWSAANTEPEFQEKAKEEVERHPRRRSPSLAAPSEGETASHDRVAATK
jgi:hypothetical protein